MPSACSSTLAQNLRSSVAIAETLSVSWRLVCAIPFIFNSNGKSGETAAKVRKVSEISLKSSSTFCGNTLEPDAKTKRLSPVFSVFINPNSSIKPTNAASPCRRQSANP